MNSEIIKKIKKISKKFKKTVVMCHGVYDVIHLGHVEHFREAKSQGDILVVSVTNDKFVKKGFGRPFFNITNRVRVLKSIKYVDFVIVSNSKDAIKNLNLLKPNIYCKGPDYKNFSEDITGMIKNEIETLKKFSGKFYLTKGKQYSSSKIINSTFNNKDQIQYIKKLNISSRKVQNDFYSLSKKKVLVIGEGIIDKYTFTDALGKSGKDPIMNYNIVNSESYVGGAISIAANLSSFCKVDTFISIGDDHKNLKIIKKSLENCNKINFFKKNNSKTQIKNRFVDNISNQKFFGIYEIDQNPYTTDDKKKITKFCNKLKKYDLIIAPDFGNDFLSKEICKILKLKHKSVSFTTQINSTSQGFNTLGKFKNAFSVFVNEKELRNEVKDKNTDIKILMKLISIKNNFKYLIVTRGKLGVILFDKKKNSYYSCPAFASNVVDKTGSGDTLYAISSLLLKFTSDIKFALYAGSLASVFNLSGFGNKKILQKEYFIKSIIYSKV